MSTRSYIIRDELSGPQALAFGESVGATSLGGIDRIELSMARASAIDVHGVAVLVRLYSQLRAAGIDVAVSSPSPAVESQLRLVGLERLFIAEEPQPSFAARILARLRLRQATT